MIIKSHVRGGYRAAANYLKQPGANEKVRLVEISDTSAKDLDEAFRNMWMVAKTTRARKPLHHVSINPFKDERLTDEQVRRICERLEDKYGYRPGDHQRVVVEHIKDGRQHFHVMWNRVSLHSGRPIWPGHHWKKSKQAAREMESELGLKRPVARRTRKAATSHFGSAGPIGGGNSPHQRRSAVVAPLRSISMSIGAHHHPRTIQSPAGMTIADLLRMMTRARSRRSEGRNEYLPVRPKREASIDELIAWAWENRRADILALFGIRVTFDL